ncbi:crk-like protein [Salpingoeca rosetta]|uniref:Crk-like protein n=1 Tax=Salpingoeca rosetta (strain ATCC 50818 / BSB-021) TaxID=946362 RepID=F2UAC8_SALR5|nr:crk-like protein [Salpingoeca rosetta]EGD73703.1 crk-like protein [Salpingoeca rosetta]|eukprot:XP_004993984.1 crk-like protein [Salpingoeca rosetta]
MGDLDAIHKNAFGEAGPAPVWFHGRVDRADVEARLTGMPDGTFLIRDSTSSVGDFVMSVSELGRTSHYKIARLGNNQYTVGDQTFMNLPAIIEYYQRHLLEQTTLSAPLPLDSAFQNGRLVDNFLFEARALYNFNARDPEDLSFRKGEVLNILQKHEEQWWKAQSQKTLQIGCIPSNYVQPLNQPEPTNTAPPGGSNFARTDSVMRPGASDQPIYANDDDDDLAAIDVTPVQPPPTQQQQAPPSSLRVSTEQAQAAMTEFLPRITSHEIPTERPKFLIARALMDRGSNAWDPTSLAFKENDIIQITKQNANGLWEGKIMDQDGNVGHFPFVMVELLDSGAYDSELQAAEVKFNTIMEDIYGNI